MSGETLGDLGYRESATIWGGQTRSDELEDGTRRFYGKYRGQVVHNIDPQGKGRLFVQSPDTLRLFPSNWAMPCVPLSGLTMGSYIVPPIGAGVWVEFENGNPNKPIWVGGYWDDRAEAPLAASVLTPGLPVMVVQTLAKHLLAVSDSPLPPFLPGGGVLMQSGTSFVKVDPSGVTITGPSVLINGLLNINAGALTVT